MWKTPKHVFVRRGNLIVQVRGEEHSLAALAAQETGLQLARAQVRGGPIAALLVIEEGAPAPTGEVARKQRELVESFSTDPRIHLAIVLEGTGVGVSLKRTMARALFRGPRRFLARTVAEGAHWLAQAVGEPEHANEWMQFVASLR